MIRNRKALTYWLCQILFWSAQSGFVPVLRPAVPTRGPGGMEILPHLRAARGIWNSLHTSLPELHPPPRLADSTREESYPQDNSGQRGHRDPHDHPGGRPMVPLLREGRRPGSSGLVAATRFPGGALMYSYGVRFILD